MDKLENDPEMVRFIAELEQTQRLKKITEKLTQDCWDMCVTNPNISRLDSKTESCIVNCVERFIDSNKLIINSFSSRSSSSAGSSGFESFHQESEMLLEDHKPEPPQKKSGGFKFW
jgi:import inner membrane translocase subunit TIM8